MSQVATSCLWLPSLSLACVSRPRSRLLFATPHPIYSHRLSLHRCPASPLTRHTAPYFPPSLLCRIYWIVCCIVTNSNYIVVVCRLCFLRSLSRLVLQHTTTHLHAAWAMATGTATGAWLCKVQWPMAIHPTRALAFTRGPQTTSDAGHVARRRACWHPSHPTTLPVPFVPVSVFACGALHATAEARPTPPGVKGK